MTREKKINYDGTHMKSRSHKVTVEKIKNEKQGMTFLFVIITWLQ